MYTNLLFTFYKIPKYTSFINYTQYKYISNLIQKYVALTYKTGHCYDKITFTKLILITPQNKEL